MKCKVCSREAQTQLENGYCELHNKAYENLRGRFEVWKKTSGLDWKGYLQQVAENPLTGMWAKEVAENLLKEDQ